MGSENKINDGTRFQQSDKPILCANGCGFFGTAATMNLCSKCFRDSQLKEEQAASAKAAVEKSMSPLTSPSSPPPSSSVSVTTEDEAVVSTTKVVGLPVSMVSPSAAQELPSETAAPQKQANRCGSCNKKVGVMGFKCRCGFTFCGSHRYPEEHGCTYDFKGAGREALAKANPLVKADKVQRF
uniref:SAP1 n=1 Tax=Tamarix hispida TaxID=189793 RepID=A0A8F8T0L6_9CARY|nr:SAP1 [Tamarix hispida]